MLVGKRIVLRPGRERDLERIYDAAADVRDLGPYWPLRMPSEQAWMKRFRENGWWEEDHGILLITDRNDALLGQMSFFKASVYQNASELGYRLYRPEHWGQGTMTEAVGLLVPYLFATKTIDRIQATVIPGNMGSQRVLEKCGFQLEGVMRKAVFHNGRNTDLKLYSILREEAVGWERVAKELLAGSQTDR